MADLIIRQALRMLLSGQETLDEAGLDLEQTDALIELLQSYRRSFFRFEMVEHFNGFAILDNLSGEKKWAGDGVDMFFDEDDDSITPGSPEFTKRFHQWLETEEDMIIEAYGFDDEKGHPASGEDDEYEDEDDEYDGYEYEPEGHEDGD
jgi:hypothetical protein